MASKKFNIKKNDKVKIIAGKDKDKIGKVLKVIYKKEKLVVENINKVKRHSKPGKFGQQSGIVEREAPVSWSNVIMMCNKCVTPIRIKKLLLDDGKRVRVCKKCNEIIDA